MDDKRILMDNWPEWEIVSQIGKGSFGTVYKAIRHDQGIESASAVKVIRLPSDESEFEDLKHEGFSDKQISEYYSNEISSFTNEINLMESLKGAQNIVSIEDYKIIKAQESFGWIILIRMELLTPLTDHLSDKQLTLDQICDLGIDVCSALEICHSKGIVHRDIKPENIFLDSFGHFKLGDFSISRKITNFSKSLFLRGTTNYIAPEIASRKAYNKTSDIYSLGIVLYKLLNNGRFPFVSASQLFNPDERQTALDMRLDGEPIPPPENTPEVLADVILKATAFQPSNRYSSAAELKKALLYAKTHITATHSHTKKKIAFAFSLVGVILAFLTVSVVLKITQSKPVYPVRLGNDVSPGNDVCSHNFGEWSVKEEATCSTDGLRERHCTDCSYSETDVIKATGHSFGEWSVTEEATCSTDGLRERHCTDCSYYETDVIKTTGHSFGEWSVTEEATCSTDGLRERHCTDCSYYETDVIKTTGHNIGEWSITKEATCITDGLRERHCSDCSYSESEVIKATGHLFGDWITEKVATSTENGYQIRQCEYCSFIETSVISAHTHLYEEPIVIKAPTCSELGIQERHCMYCDYVAVEYTRMIGHSFGEWIMEAEPTCISQGAYCRYCSMCNEREIKYIDMIEHVPGEIIFDSTKHYVTCENCATVLSGEDHIFDFDGHCSVCGFKLMDSEGLEYELNGNCYTLTGIGSCKDSVISVPSVYGELPVTAVADRAFYGCSEITSVILPCGIRSIGDEAFDGCSSLMSVSLPEGLETLGNNLFNNCFSLSELTIPGTVEVFGVSMFVHCTSLKKVTLGEGITTIPNEVFALADSIETVVLPDTLEEIGAYAFNGCGIKELDIPNNVKTFGRGAFMSCDQLEKVTLPYGIKTLSEELFKCCQQLKVLVIPDGVEEIPDSFAAYCEHLTEVVLPSSLKVICSFAFDSTLLTEVIIPEGTKIIENNAFENSTVLSDVYIPQSIEYIGSYSFRYGLRNIYYGGSVKQWNATSKMPDWHDSDSAVIHYNYAGEKTNGME